MDRTFRYPPRICAFSPTARLELRLKNVLNFLADCPVGAAPQKRPELFSPIAHPTSAQKNLPGTEGSARGRPYRLSYRSSDDKIAGALRCSSGG